MQGFSRYSELSGFFAFEGSADPLFQRLKFEWWFFTSFVGFKGESEFLSALFFSDYRNAIIEEPFDDCLLFRPLMGMSSRYAPTLESLGISDPLKPQPATSEHTGRSEENGNDELDFKGLNLCCLFLQLRELMKFWF